MPISLHGEQEAAILHERNIRLPADVPAKMTAEASVKKRRLKKKAADGEIIKPPREKAQQILKDMGLHNVVRDQSLTHSSLPPWKWKCARIRFKTELEGCQGKYDEIANIHAAVADIISGIESTDLVAYTDGSVGEDNRGGGAGAVTTWPNEESTKSMIACGKICLSYKAEMTALKMLTKEILDRPTAMLEESRIWIFTDSESAVERLAAGPGAQTDSLADDVWSNLSALAEQWETTIQWIPGHKDIEGNEAADKAAKEAASMNQDEAALDFSTMKAAIKKHFRKKWSEAVLARVGIYSKASISKQPAQLANVTRKEEITIHQLRTGSTPLSKSCWARYAGKPESKRLCPNGCNINEDVEHLFWGCPMYSAQRMRHFGSTHPERDVLFGHPRPILKFLEDIGHSTAPTTQDEVAE